MEFSQIIKKILEERKLKQTDLCRMTGIPSSLMSAYVSGKKSPAIQNAIAIAEALNVSLDELVGRIPIPNSSNLENNFIFSETEKNMIQKYRLLSPEGKETVNTILELQYKSIRPKANIKKDKAI